MLKLILGSQQFNGDEAMVDRGSRMPRPGLTRGVAPQMAQLTIIPLIRDQLAIA